MNSSEQNLVARFDRNRRSGITLIEVITSILVAVIGVFGVMVMIPFGVSQAEHGLRQEEASALARNAVSDFEIRGFSNPSLWTSFTGGEARPYVIDPIGVADRANAGQGNGFFPFVPVGGALGTGPTLDNILIDRTNIELLTSLGVQPMSREVADQLFSWSSDLVTREGDEADTNAAFPELDLLPPQQQFDVDQNTNAAIRRQARRDMSYMVVAVPAKFAQGANSSDDVFAWRNYFVVYEKRPQPVEFAGVTEHPYDRVFQVVPPPVVPAAAVNVAYSGGDLELVPFEGQNSTQTADIKRGDWMMLTNVSTTDRLADSPRSIQQIYFYKVVDAEQQDGVNPQVTLQGPNFIFPADTQTFAIHLPDVWAVFERTFR